MSESPVNSSRFSSLKKNINPLNISLAVGIVFIVLITFFSKISVANPADKFLVKKRTQKFVSVTYENPFKKTTQYNNPFSDYQNPIDELAFAEVQ